MPQVAPEEGPRHPPPGIRRQVRLVGLGCAPGYDGSRGAVYLLMVDALLP